MNYIDIIPEVRHDMFAAKIVMSDYVSAGELVIRISARRNDGTYATKTVKYPDDVANQGNEILIYMFSMSRSVIAQIVAVRINGVEVRVDSTQVDSNTTARYDDSITRIPWAETMNNIHLDFEVVGTNNPKNLRVVDQSEWGILADRPAVIEILPPGLDDKVVYYLGKNQVNIFTSITLGYNCNAGKYEYEDIPDGVYDITIKGSPSKYQFNRKYLKTDSIRLNIDKVWARTHLLCDEPDEDVMEKIKQVEFLLAAAESNMRLGNIETAKDLLEKAQRLMYIINDCDGCGCKDLG